MPQTSEQISLKASEILDAYNAALQKGFDAFCFRDLPSSAQEIFITSFLKTGTTLTQQLVYQLLCALGRVPADPDGTNFDNISQVVPTIELRNSFKLQDPIHRMSPRAWKSHGLPEEFSAVPEGHGHFVYCVRDGLDVARSFLDFTLDWLVRDEELRGGETSRPLRAEVYRQWFMSYFLGMRREERGGGLGNAWKHEWVRGDAPGPWFAHTKAWLDVRGRRVLYLVYEDVVADLPGAVRDVATHLGLCEGKLSEEIVTRVAARCGRGAMAKDARFQDTMVSDAFGWDRGLGVRVRPEGMPGFKNYDLPMECRQMYDAMLSETFGVRSYAEVADVARRKNAALKDGRTGA